MTKHHGPRHFETPPLNTSCPVADLGRKSSVIEKQRAAVDEARGLDMRESRLASTALDSFRDTAAFIQTQSPEGALFQVAIASLAAHEMFDYCTEDGNHQAEQYVDKARSALYSVRRFLETHFNLDAVAIGAEGLMASDCSPLQWLEQAALTSAVPQTAE